ncbi:MAG: ATP-binding protein [Alphaproteobacteria bacterium]|nr:ATP-binding protein [Alphaproteobacteria bacterium]
MLYYFLSQIVGKKTFKDTLPNDVKDKSFKKNIRNILNTTLLSNHLLKKKEFVNIAGLPASGKSFWAKKFLEKNPEYVYISFDLIMEKFPEYQNDFKLNPKLAFNRWELPARYLGYYLLFKAIYLGYPVLFEHSNSNINHIDLYKSIKSFYYNMSIFFINATPDIVISRLNTRKRFFPKERILERWDLIKRINPLLEKTVHHFYNIEAWINDSNEYK